MKKPVPYGYIEPEEVIIKNGARVRIRLFEKTDLDGIWNNFNEVVSEKIYLPVYTPVLTEWEKLSWYHDIHDEGNICVVAEDPQRENPENILGQLTIEHIPWEAADHVGQLGIIVKKGSRNQGIGYLLIQYGVKIAELIGKKKIILSTLATNKMGVNLYQKCGFSIIGKYTDQYFVNGHFEDELLMEWLLK